MGRFALAFQPRFSKADRAIKQVSVRLARERARTMERVVRLTERDLKQNGLTGKKGTDPFWGVTGADGDTLGTRSGHLKKSVTGRVFSRGLTTIGVVGSPMKYLAIHEEGGTISGKPYLRIPTAVMQLPSGLDRMAGKSIRGLPNTTIIKSKRGNLWVAEVGTARSELAVELNGVPLLLYLLKTQVTVRPRRVLRNCLRRMRPQIHGAFRVLTTQVVKA